MKEFIEVMMLIMIFHMAYIIIETIEAIMKDKPIKSFLMNLIIQIEIIVIVIVYYLKYLDK